MAKEIAARKVDMSNLGREPIDGSPTGGKDANRFTCEDFAFEVLIEFASRNKLPLKIQTQSVVFKNVDKDYQSGDKSAPPTPAGFAVDLAIASGVSDIAKNAVPVANKDLLPGDLFLEFNKGHVQVVTSAGPNRIEIMQGNFPGLESNPRKILSKIFLGNGSGLPMPGIVKVRSTSGYPLAQRSTSGVMANGFTNDSMGLTTVGTRTFGAQ